MTTAQKKGIVVPVQTLGVHIAETLPSLLEPDNTGGRKQYENMACISCFWQNVNDLPDRSALECKSHVEKSNYDADLLAKTKEDFLCCTM